MRIQVPAKREGKTVVAVIGGGFGGLNAAKALSKNKDVFVVLFDQRNHHLFQPLLYQVATAGLNPADIAVPIRTQFADEDNVEVHWAGIEAVNLTEKYARVKGTEVEIEFDYVVLACGAQHSYFGKPEWENYAPGLKTLEQATEIRRRLLAAFERAENSLEPDNLNSFLTFVVVGGGATGVELAGSIADIARTVMVSDFKRIDPAKTRVILVEAGPRLMAAFSEKNSERTKRDLTQLGVEVRLNARVEEINAEGVRIGSEFIPAKNVFWGAGVQAAKMNFDVEVPRDRAGRIRVGPDLSIPGHPNAFVVGDMAAFEEDGKLVPGVAPAAMQEGRHVAINIAADLKDRARKPFEYRDKGQMATIGKNKAVMQFHNFEMGGRLAWLAWLFVHIFYLVGFKNRIAVMWTWVWSYMFSKRGARLITDPNWKLEESKTPS